VCAVVYGCVCVRVCLCVCVCITMIRGGVAISKENWYRRQLVSKAKDHGKPEYEGNTRIKNDIDEGWPEPYIYTVYDRIFGDSPANNTVHIPCDIHIYIYIYIYIYMANPTCI